jgi:hypothetical protein
MQTRACIPVDPAADRPHRSLIPTDVLDLVAAAAAAGDMPAEWVLDRARFDRRIGG